MVRQLTGDINGNEWIWLYTMSREARALKDGWIVPILAIDSCEALKDETGDFNGCLRVQISYNPETMTDHFRGRLAEIFGLHKRMEPAG